MISPLGADVASSFDAAVQGRSAIRSAPADLTGGLPNLLIAPAAVEPTTLLDKRFGGLDRATQFALVAAEQAFADAEISSHPADAGRFGVFTGIGFGGAHTVDGLYSRFIEGVNAPGLPHKNPAIMHPLSVPRMMANAAAAAVSMQYGLRGPSNTYCIACASSAVAAGEAFRAIRHGYLDAAVVIGTEAMLNPGSLMAWNALRVMAKPDAADPSRSCRPFALGRTGFVLGEGAAALLLESEKRANRCQVKVLAEMVGYGCSSDAEHLTTPSVNGQVTSMQQALDSAGLGAGDIQYLNAHGTATDAGDVIESQSIRAVFGAFAGRLAVSSTKAVHGHLIGAGGAVEFVLSVMALGSGSLPPTAHLDTPDPRCDLDFIALQARHHCRIDAVMSNSFAFGGSNATLVARRYVP